MLPTAKLKNEKILFRNPQHVAIHVEASNNPISSMRFHDDRPCDSSLQSLGSEIHEIKTPRKFNFQVLVPIRKILSPQKYTIPQWLTRSYDILYIV